MSLLIINIFTRMHARESVSAHTHTHTYTYTERERVIASQTVHSAIPPIILLLQ